MGRNKRKKPARQRIVSLEDHSGSQSATPVQSPRTQLTDRVGGLNGEEYRRRLEALREEAGTGWLRVLSESPGFVEKAGQQKGKGLESTPGRV